MYSVWAVQAHFMTFPKFSNIFPKTFMKFPFRKGIICDFSIPNEPGVIFQSLTHLVTPMLCQQLNQSELENLFPWKVTSWDIGNIFRMTLIELPF